MQQMKYALRGSKAHWQACCGAVHFGMSGRFNAAAGPAPEVRPTTRLALVNEEHNLVAHLSAMTVKHGGIGE
jgi:hypothetical protein